MTSQSPARKSKHRDRGDYGFARARDLAFDAVQSLWRKRKSEGMKQVDIAKALDRSPAWVNRSLQGPGNWTLRTLGELVEALNGEIEISVYAIEQLKGGLHSKTI
jgi:predicted transcriptional regulator